MSHYEKFVARFAGKKTMLLLIAVFFTLISVAQHFTNFSGEWKLNELKTERGGFLCIYDAGDRMRSETMKIAAHEDFLTVDVPGLSLEAVTRQEKLSFDGKESEFTLLRTKKKFTVSWSDGGQTMIVNSFVYMSINGEKTEEFKVTEAWKLINGGKSLSVQATLTSTLIGERVMKHVYDKIN
jgi:hypothetical protein